MTRILLDPDVVSYHRTGRLPAEHARLVATNQYCIAFAIAGELWKGAQIQQWGGVRRAGLDLWMAKEMIPPADLDVARIWGRDHRRSTATWADAAAQRQLDRGLLPRERAALLTLNRRDFADFTEHDGLVLLGG